MPELGICKCCSGKVSNEAPACPHCGQPDPFLRGVPKITLVQPGSQPIQTIKIVRETIPGMGLKEAKDFVESVPVTFPPAVIAQLSTREVQRLIAELNAVGATIKTE